jgi:hypothetical protein
MSKKRKGTKEQFHYDPPIEQEQPVSNEPKYRLKLAYVIDPEEVAALVNASDTPLDSPAKETEFIDYPTYSEEEVLALINGEPYRRKSRKKKTVSESK